MPLDIRTLTGEALAAALPQVAALRIAVFRDWPYLYDGDLAYEERYLQSYRDSRRAVVVGAWDGAQLVGASTATPLAEHADDFAAAFDGSDIDISKVYYCAESVLLPEYRGQGAGHAFFDLREAHARSLGYEISCFCAVTRPSDHPARPVAYRPLDDFWTARGYARLPGATARFSWKDIGEAAQTAKPMQFWMRRL